MTKHMQHAEKGTLGTFEGDEPPIGWFEIPEPTPGQLAYAEPVLSSSGAQAINDLASAPDIDAGSKTAFAPVVGEPVAVPADLQDLVRKALRKAWSLGQTYFQQADSESYSQNKKSRETHQNFERLVDETLAALAAPQPAIKQSLTVEAPGCLTCSGRGLVGGWVGQTAESGGYETEPCPDCSAPCPAAPVNDLQADTQGGGNHKTTEEAKGWHLVPGKPTDAECRAVTAALKSFAPEDGPIVRAALHGIIRDAILSEYPAAAHGGAGGPHG